MARTIGEVMTMNPVSLESSATVGQAARAMRDHAIGDVLVMESDALVGILTDRDIVTRCVAEGLDEDTPVGDVCSMGVTSLSESDELSAAVETMRGLAVRRAPVVDAQGTPLGIVSLGDLALALDSESALGEISAAAPNN